MISLERTHKLPPNFDLKGLKDLVNYHHCSLLTLCEKVWFDSGSGKSDGTTDDSFSNYGLGCMNMGLRRLEEIQVFIKEEEKRLAPNYQI